MDSIDTIFFAILAVICIARLWSVLGRDDFNQDRDPGATPPNPFSSQDVVVFPTKKDPEILPPDAGVTPHGYAAASLAGALDQWRALDPHFDEKTFLSGARTAFEAILDGFAKGDLAWTNRLLAPEVARSFLADIEARRLAGQTMHFSLEAFKEVEIVEARLEGMIAFLTVRFTTLQKRFLRDAAGSVLSGDPEKSIEMQDDWIFSRDSREEDPNWQLVATRAN